MTGPHLFMVTPDSATDARCRGVVTELILRCARGEQSALGRLFDLCAPLVLAAVGDGRPDGVADDEAVAAFRRVWLRAPSYDPASHDAVGWILDQARDDRSEHLTAS